MRLLSRSDIVLRSRPSFRNSGAPSSVVARAVRSPLASCAVVTLQPPDWSSDRRGEQERNSIAASGSVLRPP